MVNFIKLSDICKRNSQKHADLNNNQQINCVSEWYDISVSKSKAHEIKTRLHDLIEKYGDDYSKIIDNLIIDKNNDKYLYELYKELTKYWYHEILEKLFNDGTKIILADNDNTLLHLIAFPNKIPNNFTRTLDDLDCTYKLFTKYYITPIEKNKFNETCIETYKFANVKKYISDEQYDVLLKNIISPNYDQLKKNNEKIFKTIVLSNKDKVINKLMLLSYALNDELFIDTLLNNLENTKLISNIIHIFKENNYIDSDLYENMKHNFSEILLHIKSNEKIQDISNNLKNML